MRRIVCTVGTSCKQKDENVCLREFSAETNSLERLRLGANDEVFLLATDTEDGLECANKVKRKILSDLQPKNIEIKQVDGLQVDSAKLFRETGLIELCKILQKESEKSYQYDVVFNVTGGFKGVVPFVTVMGMLFRIPTVYIFERSNELLTLPPLPIAWDIQLFQRALPALKRIDQESAIYVNEYFSLINSYKPEEEMLFRGFVEAVDTSKVTMSPLAFILYTIESESKGVVLSEDVMKIWEKGNKERKQKIHGWINNLASPTWRTQKIHSFSGTDLDVYKPGNTAERAAGYIENNVFHFCCLFFSHDEYEREQPKLKRKHYASRQFKALSDSDSVFT